MAWEFDCPADGCEFTHQANDQDEAVESGQQHLMDRHDESPTRDEVRQHVTGPG